MLGILREKISYFFFKQRLKKRMASLYEMEDPWRSSELCARFEPFLRSALQLRAKTVIAAPVLDAGGGEGWLQSHLGAEDYHLLDLAPKALERAKKKNRGKSRPHLLFKPGSISSRSQRLRCCFSHQRPELSWQRPASAYLQDHCQRAEFRGETRGCHRAYPPVLHTRGKEQTAFTRRRLFEQWLPGKTAKRCFTGKAAVFSLRNVSEKGKLKIIGDLF